MAILYFRTTKGPVVKENPNQLLLEYVKGNNRMRTKQNIVKVIKHTNNNKTFFCMKRLIGLSKEAQRAFPGKQDANHLNAHCA